MHPITIIDTPRQLIELTEKLRGATDLAFDTEFHPEGKYRPEPMLLQIGTADEVFLIDPLPKGMPSAVGEMLRALCEQGTTLVGHDLKCDLKILFRLCGTAPKQVVDTQIAAAFVGHGGSIGLERLARDTIGATMDKSLTLANWATRPLPEPMQAYAAGDVGFMLALWSNLREKLLSLGRLGWVEEECGRLLTPTALCENDPANAWRSVENRNKVNSRSFAVLRSLAAERERMAQDWNSPVKRVLPDAVLIDLARRAPASKIDLANAGTQRTTRPELERYADHWLAAIREGLAQPMDTLPELVFIPNSNQDAAIKLIRLFVGDQARNAQLAPELFLSVLDRQLPGLMAAPAGTFEEFESLVGLAGWRAELLSKPLWNLISGAICPRFRSSEGGLIMEWVEG